MTTSFSGQLVASAIIDGRVPKPYAEAMRPDRGAGHRTLTVGSNVRSTLARRATSLCAVVCDIWPSRDHDRAA